MMTNGSERERDEAFGLRFRLLLGYYDLTLRDISRVTGAAISTVSTWRNGKIPSSRQVIEKIAQLFRVTPAYLVYGANRLSKETSPGQEISEIEARVTSFYGQEEQGLGDAPETQRQKIEHYLSLYLDEAEKFEGGLEHAWLQILKEFPLHWFRNVGDYLRPRPSSESGDSAES
ncbi:MAG: helix-turn-helix domain-containing protein [Puniceicoccales bacterium]|jgi:transcriptional regulator with XRE-family HTH domain|nr:helix-turn-helix domain-containing protein [Puniceicoccales bacterium]